MTVDRCICKNVTFAALIEAHERTGLPFEDLAREMDCCTACGLCDAYARAAVATGRPSLPACSPGQLGLLVKREMRRRERLGTARPKAADRT